MEKRRYIMLWGAGCPDEWEHMHLIWADHCEDAQRQRVEYARQHCILDSYLFASVHTDRCVLRELTSLGS